MAILAENNGNGGGNYAPVEAGTYVARCVSMIHLGTLNEEFNGEKKELNKVRISWELPTEMKVFKEENGEQPNLVSKDFTLSMHEKASLRKFLQSWRGKAFTEAEAKSFDITKLMGKPCMLSIIHKQSKTSGKAYADISSVSVMVKGMTCPEQINETFEYSVLNHSEELFSQIPKFLQEKIITSKEYKALNVTSKPVAQSSTMEEEPPF
jgi:hypothetical protein